MSQELEDQREHKAVAIHQQADIDTAARCARRGDYVQALALLENAAGGSNTEPAVLDLLARIHAQRGEFGAAEEYWARVEASGAYAHSARAGLLRIAELRAQRHRSPRGRATLLGALAGLVILGAGIVGIAVARPGASEQAALRQTQQQIGSLSGQVDKLEHRADPLAVRRQQLLDKVSGALASAHTTVSTKNGQVGLTLGAPMFSRFTTLSSEGTALLADTAERLRPMAGQLSITVIGHTEAATVAENSGYADNADLGLQRARTAAASMSTSSGLPLSSFTLATAGADQAPYSNSTETGQALNRTVTLIVRPN